MGESIAGSSIVCRRWRNEGKCLGRSGWKFASMWVHKALKSRDCDWKIKYKCTKYKRMVDDRAKYMEKEKQIASTLYLEGYDLRRIARVMMKIYGKLFHSP